ncbi:MAG: sigma-70 family RNA polymerase sigma factor, partial [Alphaproteobacteria bacterium]
VIVRVDSAHRQENDDMKQMADCIRAVAERADREAFGELFAFYAPRLKAFLIKRGASPGEAEDVMQEAMTLVWRKAGQFDPAKASASTWIYTIARNRRIDLIRRAKRPELDPEDPFFTSVSDQPDGEEEYTRTQRAEVVRTYLKTLPAEQLQVVRKAFYEEMTHQEIAAELDMPLGTVKSRIRIAMRRLRDQLDGAEL